MSDTKTESALNPNETISDQIDYSYNDLKDQSIREVAQPTEAAPVEETPVETPKEEVVTQPVDEVKERIDKEQDEERERRIAEEAANKVVQDLEAKRQAEEAAKVEPVKDDPYTKWQRDFFEKEKRQPTYVEALEFVKDRAKEEMRQEQIAEQQFKEEEARKAQAVQAEESKRINTYVDDELNDLYTSGRLTKIQDPNNPSDPGVVERKSLFSKWQEVNAQRRSEGKPEIISATRIAEFYWKKPNVQPAGANAPIAGNKGSATPPSTQDSYSYADLKRPWSTFKK